MSTTIDAILIARSLRGDIADFSSLFDRIGDSGKGESGGQRWITDRLFQAIKHENRTDDKGQEHTKMFSADSTFSDLAADFASTLRSLKQLIGEARTDFAAASARAAPKRIKFAGMDIAIENPVGSVRSGTSKKGKKWSVQMRHAYGFIPKGNGADGEGLDCFIGHNPNAANVHVVHQNNPETGSYDEDKTMIGFDSPEQAKAAYLANYDTPKFYRSMTIIPLAQFKSMLTKGDPGGTHWKLKNRRDRETDAIFSTEDFDEQMGFEWITIGGHAEGGKKHHGGTHVQVDESGEIQKGPKELKGKNVKNIKKEEPAEANPSPGLLWGDWGKENGDPEKEPTPNIDKPEPQATINPKKEEPANVSTPEPATREGTPGNDGSGAEPADRGAIDSGGDQRDDPSREEAGWVEPTRKTKILTARPELTKPADASIVPESLRQHLSEHQTQGVATAIHAMENHGGFLCADSTGVGKTREQLAVAKFYADQGKKVLIVTKAEVIKPNWDKKTVTGSFASDSKAMGIDISLNSGDEPLKAGDVHVTTYDRIGRGIKSHVDKNTVVLFDESHAMKNKDRARAKHGMEMAQEADKCLFLTATPVDKPLHISHLARAGIFGNRAPSRTYENLGLELQDIPVRRGQKPVKAWKLRPGMTHAEVARRLSGLYDKMTEEGLMIRRELSMDNVDVKVNHIKLDPKVHDKMAAIEEHLQEQYGHSGGLVDALILMHQRRQQEPYKIPWVVENAKKELDEGRSVVIFCSRVNESAVGGDEGSEDEPVDESEGTAKLLKEALQKAGIESVELHGGVTPKKRIEAMNDFQDGKARCIVATVEAGGTGINLDDTVGDKPRTMFMMTAPFTAVDNVQAAGRINRLKTKSRGRIHYVFGDTDVDAWNAGIIAKKMKALGAAVQGDVGKLDVVPDRVKKSEMEDESELPPYKWPSLTDHASAEEIQPRAVETRFGMKYVHDIPLTPEIEKKIQGKPLPKWLSEGEYKGRKKLTVWGNNHGDVRDKYAKFMAGHFDEPAAPALPSGPISDEEMPPVSALEKMSQRLKPEDIAHIHRTIKHIAGFDSDMARVRNDAGFNQNDTTKGNALAAAGSLTPSEAARAAHMVRKYRRQMPEEMSAKLDAIMKDPLPQAASTSNTASPSRPSRNFNASPAKLRDGSWGARVSGDAAVGDRVKITTKSGKSWTATVKKVLWSGDGATLVETNSNFAAFSADLDEVAAKIDRALAMASLLAA